MPPQPISAVTTYFGSAACNSATDGGSHLRPELENPDDEVMRWFSKCPSSMAEARKKWVHPGSWSGDQVPVSMSFDSWSA
jgi:hypothetical protein